MAELDNIMNQANLQMTWNCVQNSIFNMSRKNDMGKLKPSDEEEPAKQQKLHRQLSSELSLNGFDTRFKELKGEQQEEE